MLSHIGQGYARERSRVEQSRVGWQASSSGLPLDESSLGRGDRMNGQSIWIEHALSHAQCWSVVGCSGGGGERCK